MVDRLSSRKLLTATRVIFDERFLEDQLGVSYDEETL